MYENNLKTRDCSNQAKSSYSTHYIVSGISQDIRTMYIYVKTTYSMFGGAGVRYVFYV